eukprot:gene24430-10441_t
MKKYRETTEAKDGYSFIMNCYGKTCDTTLKKSGYSQTVRHTQRCGQTYSTVWSDSQTYSASDSSPYPQQSHAR